MVKSPNVVQQRIGRAQAGPGQLQSAKLPGLAAGRTSGPSLGARPYLTRTPICYYTRGGRKPPRDREQHSVEKPLLLRRLRVRRFAQPLGIDLDRWEGRVIETKKGVVRLLPVAERATQLFGKDGATAVAARLPRHGPASDTSSWDPEPARRHPLRRRPPRRSHPRHPRPLIAHPRSYSGASKGRAQ